MTNKNKLRISKRGATLSTYKLLGTDTYKFCYNDSGVWYGQKEDGGDYVTMGFSEFNDLYNFVLKND